MRNGIAIVAIGLALCLGGCDTLDGDLFGDDAPVADSNGCTSQGCPQAPQFCAARGYTPGTERYANCIVSVEQNLRRASR